MKIRIVCALAVACGCLSAVSATDMPRPEDRQLVEQSYPAMFGYTRLMTSLFPDDHVPAAEGSDTVAEREKAAHLEWLRTLKLTRSFAVLLGKEVDAQELGGKIEKCTREFANRFGQMGVDWNALNAQAREKAKIALRPGVPGKAPFWNAKARAFIHAPAFDFKAVANATSYRFTVTEKATGKVHVSTAAVPWAPLAPLWDELPPGYVTVKAEGLDAAGAVCGVAGTRDCYRAAVFKGPYPAPANRDYAAAARRCYAAVAHLPHVRRWLTATEPSKLYDLYCYPSKILSSMIRAILRYAATAPAAEKAECHQICRNMADWLISVSQPADAVLPHLPPTYWGDGRSTAVLYRGQNMLLYPFEVASAYFLLADATGVTKYRDEGLAICRTLLKMQNAEGTWWLKVYEKDGKPVRPNLIVPDRGIVACLRTAARLTGDDAYAKAAERACEYELKGPFATWNWDGQFEDIDPLPPYSNLEKGRPADFAGWMFEKGRVADGCLLVDWCEDQFVVWSDPIHHMDWQHWKMPTALEQYEYYTPIDASMGNLISAFAKAWVATGDALYREKAIAMADCVLRHQRPNGTIPTYFDTRSENDWVNCMVYTSECLEELAAALAASDTATVDEEGFRPLFNGRDLSGWDGATNTYCVSHEGWLTCVQDDGKGGGEISNLWTTRDYTNFVIRFEVKMPPNANNGLGIRTRANGWCSREGIEIQLLDDWGDQYRTLKPSQYTGAIYGVVAPRRKPNGESYLKKPGEWNAVEVMARGTFVQVTLNGTVIVAEDVAKYPTDTSRDGVARPGLHNLSGRLHWCGHGHNIFWRDIRIKEL